MHTEELEKLILQIICKYWKYAINHRTAVRVQDISEVTTKFGFSRLTISRMYHEYKFSGKTSNLR